ncbi:MAG: hypothetical protein K8S56_06190, partial [Candidatus Cloacimonetes bacterium]|nr:hypothetical protein [Candidatus Cloacimonadota bacterium]
MNNRIAFLTVVLLLCMIFALVADTHASRGGKLLLRNDVYTPEQHNMYPYKLSYIFGYYCQEGVLQYLTEVWHESTNAWETSGTTTYTYGADGITYIVMVYPGISEQTYTYTWVGGHVTQCDYTVTPGELSQRESYIWNGDELVSWFTEQSINGGDWTDVTRGTMTYSNGKPVEYNEQYFYLSEWVDFALRTSTYNIDGH